MFIVIASNYYSNYSEETHTDGLTVWGLGLAKERFKGSKINNREGEKIKLNWKLKESEEDLMFFSKNDMLKLAADKGDLVYLTDSRKILGGLKSAHSIFGEPHNEDGIVYFSQSILEQGQFISWKISYCRKRNVI